MHDQLTGKSAFVTGAGRGIGRGIAVVLAERGADVAVCDLDLSSAESVAREVAAKGRKSLALQADVTSRSSIENAVRRAIAGLGRIDICVANAGVIGAAGFTERPHYSEEDWDVTFDVNVKGVAHTVDAIALHMRDRHFGRIVIVASHGGRKPRGAVVGLGTVGIPYSVSKAAAIQYTHHAALMLSQYNINVNCVCPGTLWTPMWEKIAENRVATDAAWKGRTPREVFDASVKSRTPLGRPQTPEDIGKAVAFLASDDASEITGQGLNVNGGAVMN
ncbi:MAG: SDR family oxidoreductase [Chloroflexi bacterium]|nr:SDR family oxidoreductase [Chloroflexota bacterium]